MSTIKERLAAARLPERWLEVCLRGDLAAEYDELDQQLRRSRQEAASRRRVASKSTDRETAERMEALREQMTGEMLGLRLRALPRAEWQELRRKHRDDDKANALGIDLEAFLSDALPRSVVEPELDADDWKRLDEVLSVGDFDRLTTTVWELNQGGVDVPKSRLASLVMAESDDASK